MSLFADASLAMSDKEKRVFGLDYSFHTSLFQVAVDSSHGEGLIDDVCESFDDLDSIFHPSSGDEMNSMLDIARGKFGWTATSGLLELRTLFGTKPRDGRCVNTSDRGNGVSRLTSIKLGKDRML